VGRGAFARGGERVAGTRERVPLERVLPRARGAARRRARGCCSSRRRAPATCAWASGAWRCCSIVASRRLAKAKAGRERNGIARDSYSYLHIPMIAGVALIAYEARRYADSRDRIRHELAHAPVAE
jgi:hypothetical protein